MGQRINHEAVNWAIEQVGLPSTAKFVLMIFAIHANDDGYTWPSIERIASISCQDVKTVRRQIKLLLVRHLIF
jgi:hypothetical protein